MMDTNLQNYINNKLEEIINTPKNEIVRRSAIVGGILGFIASAGTIGIWGISGSMGSVALTIGAVSVVGAVGAAAYSSYKFDRYKGEVDNKILTKIEKFDHKFKEKIIDSVEKTELIETNKWKSRVSDKKNRKVELS